VCLKIYTEMAELTSKVVERASSPSIQVGSAGQVGKVLGTFLQGSSRDAGSSKLCLTNDHYMM
jgi:hypothetical protein